MQLISKQKGITLIEMMIAMLLGLIVSGTIITIFITTVFASTAAIKMVKLNQELRASMMLMAKDIRRAGYWSDPTTPSPYLDTIEVVGTNCILLAYDDPSGNDFIGYKLENGSVKRVSSNSVLADCNDGTWNELTDVDTDNVTQLDFIMSVRLIGNDATVCSSGDCNIEIGGASSDLQNELVDIAADGEEIPSGYITEVKITLRGESKSDAALRRTMTETIRIRNNGLI